MFQCVHANPVFLIPSSWLQISLNVSAFKQKINLKRRQSLKQQIWAKTWKLTQCRKWQVIRFPLVGQIPTPSSGQGNRSKWRVWYEVACPVQVHSYRQVAEDIWAIRERYFESSINYANLYFFQVEYYCPFRMFHLRYFHNKTQCQLCKRLAGGSHQPFSCVLGHVRHGDVRTNKRPTGWS